jgi:uncharacterized membrane protein YtjA (UPF0391 family)
VDDERPSHLLIGDTVMLHWAIFFLVFALIAAALGFGGLAGTTAYFAKVLLVVFLVLFLISLVAHGRQRPLA